MFRRRDQQQHAVVFLRLAKFPESKQSIGVGLDVAALQRFYRRDNELNAGLILKLLKLCFERAAAVRADDIGLIDHAAGQRRIVECEGNERRKAENDCGNRYSGASHCGGLLKFQNFTVGGFSEPSLAVKSAIGFSPENAVFAQITVGKVRSAVLKARTASM